MNGAPKQFTLSAAAATVQQSEETKYVEEITPSVVEPSFGIGRIMYVVLEHAFRQRAGDEQRNFLELPPIVAPIKCSVLPISANEKLNGLLDEVRRQLTLHELSFKVDDSAGSIGRRYARTDEIGIPFGATVDFESEKDGSVTLRHAPSMQQVRLKVSPPRASPTDRPQIEELGRVVSDLVHNRLSWESVTQKFPLFTSAEN